MKNACTKGSCRAKDANADLKAIAEAFVNLQQARHFADYDYAKVFTRVEALTHINTARTAFERWGRIRGKDFAQDFLLALFVADRR